MRICIVYDCLFPYTVGGGERWYSSLADRLARAGHEVTYLTLRQWERGAPPAGAVRVVAVGPRMALYTSGGRRRILPPLLFGAGVMWHLLRNGREYDAVDTGAFPYFSLLAAAALRRAMGYELVVNWFEVWSAEYWREYLGAAGGRLGRLVQRLCARVPQRAFCLSELHARRLRDEGVNGPVTVLRGLYAGPTDPAEPNRVEPRVLFAGRLIPEKRVLLALEAIALAANRIEGLRATILGDGPQREALLRAIAADGLQELVSAPGFTDAETVQREMRRAMCLLLTSRREGYGLVVVEAAAQATPSVVVAGEDNAATDLIEEGVNGTVAPSSEAQAVADAIVRIHEAGERMRASTAAWFARNVDSLTVESSLQTVLDSYSSARA